MLARMKGQVSNDPLWAVLAGLGCAALIAIMVFGGLEEGSALYVRLEAYAEALGAFMLGALGRWRVEKGSAPEAVTDGS